MTSYVLRRLAQSLVVALVLLILVFFVGHVMGDPVELMLPIDAPEELQARMRAEFGFDAPLQIQFVHFIERVFTGFGDSLWQKAPALGIALERIVPTLYLTVATVALAVPISILLGSLAARNPNSVVDRVVSVVSLAGISTVDFWLGLLLIFLFSITLGWLPTSGYGGVQYLILPVLALAGRSIGRITQITRSAMLDEYAKPYIQVARANGIPEHRVFLHALKNASIPVLTIAGDDFATLMGGTFAIETIFAWPGIGRLLVQAIYQRDLFLIEATVFVIVLVIIVVNLIVDLTYALLDPKVRYQ